MSSLETVVRELRRSAGRAAGVRQLHHAVLGATVWALAVVIAARFTPIEETVRLVALGIPLALVVATVVWFAKRPSATSLLRAADVRLGLKERLSTAWERRALAGPLDQALRRDALDAASRATLTRAFPPRFRRREAVLAGAVTLTVVALVLLPNPMDQVLAQRKADRAAQASAAATIQSTQKKVAATPTPAPVDAQVQKILQDAKAKIASAPDARTALQSITPAEQQLLQLSDPQTPARASSARNLASNLATTQSGKAAAQAITAGPGQGAKEMRNLASQLPAMSAKDRAELAKALAAAAQQSADPQMAASLQQASAALARGDVAGAQAALDDVAGQLDSLQGQESNDQEIAAAINGLEAARQQLAAQADRDAGAGAATASGSPRAVASGAGNGGGNGNGNGTGNGNGNGSGNGGNGGSGGTGGQGNSGSGSGQGTSAQSTERVYVPAAPQPGQTETDPAPLGPGQDVPMTPYTQVIQGYEQTALDAADQSLIPGSERDLVRSYFASLGDQGSGS